MDARHGSAKHPACTHGAMQEHSQHTHSRTLACDSNVRRHKYNLAINPKPLPLQRSWENSVQNSNVDWLLSELHANFASVSHVKNFKYLFETMCRAATWTGCGQRCRRNSATRCCMRTTARGWTCRTVGCRTASRRMSALTQTQRTSCSCSAAGWCRVLGFGAVVLACTATAETAKTGPDEPCHSPFLVVNNAAVLLFSCVLAAGSCWAWCESGTRPCWRTQPGPPRCCSRPRYTRSVAAPSATLAQGRHLQRSWRSTVAAAAHHIPAGEACKTLVFPMAALQRAPCLALQCSDIKTAVSLAH